MNLRRALAVATAMGAMFAARAVVADAPPLAPYRPSPNTTATLRLAGNRHMADVARAWADGYHAQHPETNFEIKLLGNGTAMPALYLGLADVVFFGRDLIVTDVDGFAHVRRYDPLRIELGTGSLDTPGKSPALVLLVHRDNTLAQLTLAQVDAIFSSQRRRGAPAAIRTWGELGLKGEWASQPIHVYADDTQSAVALFFQRVALGDSRRMNWEHFTGFQDIWKPDGTVVEAAQQSAAALRTDRYGLAVSNLHYLTADLKPIALATEPGGSAVAPTRDNLVSRAYQLARPILAVVDQPPGRQLDPKVRAFLSYLLSAEGQRAIERDGSFLPLSKEAADAQRRKLE